MAMTESPTINEKRKEPVATGEGINIRTFRLFMLMILAATASVFCPRANAAVAGEGVTNGGFETGDFTGWITAAGPSGSWAVQDVIRNTGIYSALGTNIPGVRRQDIDATPVENITSFSFHVYQDLNERSETFFRVNLVYDSDFESYFMTLFRFVPGTLSIWSRSWMQGRI